MRDPDSPAVAIIDYGMGNLFSVRQACECVGIKPVITADRSVIDSSDALILPGVGAFGDAMDCLQRMDLVSSIRDFISSGKPFMGICLGLQLLMSYSEEFGVHKGLDIIKGKVVRFPDKDDEGKKNKVPQVGWNRIYLNSHNSNGGWDITPLSGTNNSEFMYFVHSYYAVPDDKGLVLSTSRYGGTEYCSSLLYKNVFAVQFHPEKSAAEGIEIYKNWSRHLKD
jgi:glutamine amidotransferase